MSTTMLIAEMLKSKMLEIVYVFKNLKMTGSINGSIYAF